MKTFASLLLSAIFGISAPQGVEEETYVSEDSPVAIEQTIEDTEMRHFFYEVFDLVNGKVFIGECTSEEESMYINEEKFYELFNRYTQLDVSIARNEGLSKYLYVTKDEEGIYHYQWTDCVDRFVDTSNDKYYIEVDRCLTRPGGNRSGSICIYNKETNELINFYIQDFVCSSYDKDQITGSYYNAETKVLERFDYKKNYDKDIYEHIYEIEYKESNAKIEYILNEDYLKEEQEEFFRNDICVNEFPYMTKEEYNKLAREQEERIKQERAAENARKLEEQLKKQEENKESTNINDDEIVYWTRGDSYHKDSNCHNYVQAKYHYSGTMKECPKFDPCDDCCY